MTTKRIEKAEVSLPSESTVRVARSFAAPRELVYRAFTEPALVPRWMLGPPGWTMPVCAMDVRVGGKFRWRWRSDDGKQEFGFHGEFTEVSAPAKLVHTEFYDPGNVGGDMGEGALVTLELTEEGAITTAVTTIDFHTKAARDAAMATGMTGSMDASYTGLDELLRELG